MEKCESSERINIGFIGGSITEGAGASVPANRYSSVFCSYIRKCFPNLKSVNEINAGVSATPSRFGCSRVRDDLLSKSPDLTVIEFAVNDIDKGDHAFLQASMEGLVRQCLAYDSAMPVILLFMSTGNGTNVQSDQEKIGLHYSLPMISYRDAIWPVIEPNPAMFDSFFHDDPHPNDNGHRLAAYLLYAYLKSSIQSTGHEPALSVPAPRVTDLYQFADLMRTSDSSMIAKIAGWKQVKKENGRIGFVSSSSDSSELVINTSKGEVTLGIRMVTAKASGIRIMVDGGKMDTTIDNGYVLEYLKLLPLLASESPAGHTITIKHFGSNEFGIDYVLYAGK